jgi:DNA polymerase III gamma/tau subunit
MIHSILITGGNAPKRFEKAAQLAEDFLGKPPPNHPDFLVLEDNQSIKISQIRELQKKLSLKPYSASVKVALINEAERLTIPAQHALLKTLEEPPAATIIILTTQTKESLLPTIVSRCQVVTLKPILPPFHEPLITNYQLLITKILKSSPGKRLLLAENYAQTGDQTREFCENQLVIVREILRQKILSLPTSHLSSLDFTRDKPLTLTPTQIVKILRHLHQSLRLLEANVNPHLVLGNLLLSYPKQAKI